MSPTTDQPTTDQRSLLLGDLWQLLEADFRQARNVFAETFSDIFRHATTESERRDLE